LKDPSLTVIRHEIRDRQQSTLKRIKNLMNDIFNTQRFDTEEQMNRFEENLTRAMNELNG